MHFAILGLGTAVPATAVTQSESMVGALSLCCRTQQQIDWLSFVYRGAGIEHRHSVLPRSFMDDLQHGTRESGCVFLPSGEEDGQGPTTAQRMVIYRQEAGPLALRAARSALGRSGLAAGQITHLVTVSCTGFFAPGVDRALIEELPLPPTVARTNVGFMGCHGALNGLRVAQAFTGADPDARVLLCAIELCSLHFQYGWDPGQAIANAIFADGAAAVVGAGRSATAPPDAWHVAATGSCIFPGSMDAMSWSIADHGFVMTLSKDVPGLIQANLRAWLEGWLAGQGLTIDGVASWAIHPGGPRILTAVEEALGLSPRHTQDAREVFAANGNMSSATVLFILERMRARNAARPCVTLGFGPGLAVEAVLFR
jgi:predicted naringenin-chalcone synthase